MMNNKICAYTSEGGFSIFKWKEPEVVLKLFQYRYKFSLDFEWIDFNFITILWTGTMKWHMLVRKIKIIEGGVEIVLVKIKC